MKKAVFLAMFLTFFLLLTVIYVKGKTDSEKIDSILKKAEDIYRIEKYKISIGSTDYNLYDNATVFAKIYQDDGKTINDAFCDVMIFYPNKTYYTSYDLPYLSNSRGLYLRNNIPLTETGVYPLDIECIRPIIESQQRHYFRISDSTYLYLANSSGQISASIKLTDVGVGSWLCYPDRFSEADEFQEYRFIENITDIYGYFQKSGAGTAEFTFVLRFYIETPYGEVHIGSTLNTTSITTTPTLVHFPDFSTSQFIPENSNLEVEWCVKKETTPISDVQFFFNSTNYNSSFMVNALAKNVTLDFYIGGSAEFNVRNFTVTTLSEGVLDDIALKVVQYFYALKDKLLTVRLW